MPRARPPLNLAAVLCAGHGRPPGRTLDAARPDENGGSAAGV